MAKNKANKANAVDMDSVSDVIVEEVVEIVSEDVIAPVAVAVVSSDLAKSKPERSKAWYDRQAAK